MPTISSYGLRQAFGNRPVTNVFDHGHQAFTGADIRVLIVPHEDKHLITASVDYLASMQKAMLAQDMTELSDADNRSILANMSEHANKQSPENVQLFNIQSLTVSSFRAKTQVRALGSVNPRGIARGSRTLAGTMILAEFNRDPFWDLISTCAPPQDDDNIGDAGASLLVDQLPSFNVVMVFAHELGALAYRILYGVEIVTNGIVYSIQDMYHEGTYSFLARDFTPLSPIPTSTTILTTAVGGYGSIHGQNKKIMPFDTVDSGRELARRYRILAKSNRRDI